MINTLSIYEDLKPYLGDEGARKLAAILGRVYQEVADTVTKKEFVQLTETVKELAEAQKRTEARVEELAEAQKRTEERLEELAQAQKRTEEKVEKLAEAQQKTETRLGRVETALGELAEAQKRTETRVEELAEAQQKTETRLGKVETVLGELAEAHQKAEARLSRVETAIEQLARAQRKTAESLDKLTREHGETRKRLENMSDAVGYSLENQSYINLPHLLSRDHGIKLEGRLIRRYLPGKKKGQYIQANIYGWGKVNGDRVLILGEAKTSISKKGITRFQKLVKKISEIENVPYDKICQVIVVHDVTPNVEEYARERGITLYWSYELATSRNFYASQTNQE